MYKVRVAVMLTKYGLPQEVKWVKVPNLLEAANTVVKFANDECFEDWKFIGGDVKEMATGNIVGVIDERLGKLISVGKDSNEYYEFIPDYQTITDVGFKPEMV